MEDSQRGVDLSGSLDFSFILQPLMIGFGLPPNTSLLAKLISWGISGYYRRAFHKAIHNPDGLSYINRANPNSKTMRSTRLLLNTEILHAIYTDLLKIKEKTSVY